MNEVRLIDANALKYKNLAEVNGRLTYVLTPEEIDNAPTVGRPQGEWELCEDTYFSKCSICGSIWLNEECNNYCPTCGAYMRSDNNGKK